VKAFRPRKNHIEICHWKQEKIENTSYAGCNTAKRERGGDSAIHIDTHQRSRFLILRYGAHGFSDLCALYDRIQDQHENKCADDNGGLRPEYPESTDHPGPLENSHLRIAF
jgi:hypothetical protein